MKFMNKKGVSEIEGRNLLIAVVGSLLIFTLLLSFVYEGTTHYNATIEPEYAEVFERINSTYSPIETISEDLQTRAEEVEEFNVVESVITAGGALIDALKIFFDTIPIISIILGVVADIIGIPPVVIGMIFTIFIIFIATLIIGLIRGKKI